MADDDDDDRLGVVVQMARTPDCRFGGRGFESRSPRPCRSVVQWENTAFTRQGSPVRIRAGLQ